MSREELLKSKIIINNSSSSLNISELNNSSFHKIPGRVDINNLMSKVRKEEKKQKKENLVFLALVSSVVIITGIIASF